MTALIPPYVVGEKSTFVLSLSGKEIFFMIDS